MKHTTDPAFTPDPFVLVVAMSAEAARQLCGASATARCENRGSPQDAALFHEGAREWAVYLDQ